MTVKKRLARILVKAFKRKPTTVAKLLNISRATVYRYIQNS